MTALVLDTGALVALERDDRRVWELLREATDTDEIVQVPAGVIAQAWRDGSRQVLMVRALAHCDEIPLDGAGARDSGSLCGRAGSTDVIDASVVVTASWLAAHDSVAVITSDPDDIRTLASAYRLSSNEGHLTESSVTPGALETHTSTQLCALRDALDGAARIIETLNSAAMELVTAFGVRGAVSPIVLDRLAKLGELANSETPPEPDWFHDGPLEAAREAHRVLSEIVPPYIAQRDDLMHARRGGQRRRLRESQPRLATGRGGAGRRRRRPRAGPRCHSIRHRGGLSPTGARSGRRGLVRRDRDHAIRRSE